MRVLPIVAAAVVLAAAAAFALRSDPSEQSDTVAGRRSIEEMANEIGAPVMELLRRGHVPGRSGHIQLVPRPHNYMTGEMDLTRINSDDPDTFISHPNPWAYLARVPLILYQPGSIPAGTTSYEEVDIAQLAPTYARILGVEGLEADSGSLDVPASSVPPRAIVTVVVDGGGWNVLRQHPGAWPTIRRLAEGGTSYLNATIGSAPALTGPTHANIGTGAYPKSHGIPNNPLWDVANLRVPTISDLWDRQQANAPVVAAIAFHGFHLGMLGQGSHREGTDPHVAVLWNHRDNSWSSPETFTLPDYLAEPDIETLESYERELDERDGVADGLWFGHTLEELREEVLRPATPAFVRLHGDATIDILQNEGFGRDAITDLLWVEMKMPDYAGHQWNMVAPEVGDVMAETDAQIGRLVDELDALMGNGNYLLAITADHGQEPIAETTGGWRINSRELRRDLNAEFGEVVRAVTMQDVRLDADAVESNRVDLNEIAEFIGAYTIEDNIPPGIPGEERVPPGRMDEQVFAGAFPTDFLRSLKPGAVRRFGGSDYEEGKLTIGDGSDE